MKNKYIHNRLRKHKEYLLLVLFAGMLITISPHLPPKQISPPTLPMRIIEQTATGTPARIERELKYSLQKPSSSLYSTTEIINSIAKDLQLSINNKSLIPPKSITEQYYLTTSSDAFIFFDIYLDTPNNLLHTHNAQYRLRQRFYNNDHFLSYRASPQKKDSAAYRIEFQTKVGRKKIADGTSETEESRFEFRKESAPFSSTNCSVTTQYFLYSRIRKT